MKCLILAGGSGERLWPLSRKNYPKQFIPIQKNHSMFQETVSRNLPFCDEFIIITKADYRFIVEDQMKAFQGTPYRCVYEEKSRGTLNAIALACMNLTPSEYVFVVVSDHVIYSRPESGSGEKDYKDSVMQAKEYAREGFISLFTVREHHMNPRFGYIRNLAADGRVGEFIEKPQGSVLASFDLNQEAVYRNLGMLLFRADVFLNELSKLEPDHYQKLKKTFSLKNSSNENLRYEIEGSEKTYDLWESRTYYNDAGSYDYYSAESEADLSELIIAKALLEKTDKLKAVKGVFLWSQIDSLEDLEKTDYTLEGKVVTEDCYDSVVINHQQDRTVVVNGLDNIIVANTPDAVYISRKGRASEIRQIMEDHPELQADSEQGTMFYRPWGHYEELASEESYRIRRVFLPADKLIPAHRHENRNENITIVHGQAKITKNGESRIYNVKDNVDLPAGTEHQIENAGEEVLVFVETAVGEIGHGKDLILKGRENEQADSKDLIPEALVKLSPAFKDYLWGGTKLRDIYGMKCDYDIIAEGWMMSAHPAGESILDSGRYKGMHFGNYVKGIGREALGWKCSPLQNFPIMVKFIDAKQSLSVQVHPNDDYALEHENEYGKNEMWYVMAAEPGAGLYVGFNRDVSREEVARRVEDNTILEVLNFYETKPGDVYYIPAGTVHAIGAGNLICEIQQSSNCTYRLYDYDRRDKFGNARELHLDKALDVLNFHKFEPEALESEQDSAGTVITRCKYFESTVYDVQGQARIPVSSSNFASIICMQGQGILRCNGEELAVQAGESIFVPAIDSIVDAEGQMTLILSHV